MAQVEIAFDAPAVDWWVLTPQIILVGAALGLLLAASLAPRALPGWVSTIVTIATGAATAITAAVQWNDWGSAPRSTLKDAFVSDGFSLLLTVLVGAGVVMTALVAHSALDRYEMAPPEFAALLLASAAGAVVMAGANDLIVLFLGLESLSIALYVLIALAGRRASARESAMKYFVLGAFSSAFFLYGIALVYGSTGSTNLSGIGGFLFGSIRETDYLLLAGIALLLVGLGFKVAAVPFHFWAPDVYEGAPSPVTGYLASIAKAAGFAALARYSFMALGSFAVLSVVGAELQSSEPDASAHALSRYGGLARRRPVLALAFTVLLLAQAGVPFTAGFWAKLGVILAAVDARGYVLPAVAMVTAVVSAFAYLRVVLAMYAPEGSSEDEGGTPTARASRQRWGNLPLTSVFAISLAVAVTVVVGVLPQTLLEWSRDAILSIIL